MVFAIKSKFDTIINNYTVFAFGEDGKTKR